MEDPRNAEREASARAAQLDAGLTRMRAIADREELLRKMEAPFIYADPSLPRELIDAVASLPELDEALADRMGPNNSRECVRRRRQLAAAAR